MQSRVGNKTTSRPIEIWGKVVAMTKTYYSIHISTWDAFICCVKSWFMSKHMEWKSVWLFETAIQWCCTLSETFNFEIIGAFVLSLNYVCYFHSFFFLILHCCIQFDRTLNCYDLTKASEHPNHFVVSLNDSFQRIKWRGKWKNIKKICWIVNASNSIICWWPIYVCACTWFLPPASSSV